MDPTQINIKFLRDFEAQRLIETPDSPKLVDIGICNLHVLHGAFRFGVTKTGWKMAEILRALSNLFSYTYARRSDYSQITKSGQFKLYTNNVELFKLNYCHFWDY